MGFDVIKDLSKDQMKEKKVFDKKEGEETLLTNETEKAINEKVEKSFREFLNSGKGTKTQKDFNEWLDQDVSRILDQEKINEIKKTNADIEQALGDLNFNIELENLTKELNNREPELRNNINITTTKDVTPENFKALLKTISTTNFKEKKYIVERLNGGKKEDIRKIQYLLIGKKDEYKEKKRIKGGSVLPKWGADGVMGAETFNALKKYVEDPNNKVTRYDIVKGPDEHTSEQKTKSQIEPSVMTIEHNVDLSTPELTEEMANQLIEQEKNGQAISLPNLTQLNPNIAKILAKFEGTHGLYLTGLEKLDTQTLNEFKNGKCKFVQFKNGELIKQDGEIYVQIRGGEKISYTNINQSICDLLLGKQATNQNSNGGSQTKFETKPTGNGEAPESYVSLSSLTMANNVRDLNISERNSLSDLRDYIEGFMSQSNSESSKKDYITKAKQLFSQSGTITYKGEKMKVDDFFSKLSKGEIDGNIVKKLKMVRTEISDFIGIEDGNGSRRYNIKFDNINIPEDEEIADEITQKEIDSLFNVLTERKEIEISKKQFEEIMRIFNTVEFSNKVYLVETIKTSLQNKNNNWIYSIQRYFGGGGGKTMSLPQFGDNGILNGETYNLMKSLPGLLVVDGSIMDDTMKSYEPLFDEHFKLSNGLVEHDTQGNYIRMGGQKYREIKGKNFTGLGYRQNKGIFELGYFENGKINGRGIQSVYDGKIVSTRNTDWSDSDGVGWTLLPWELGENDYVSTEDTGSNNSGATGPSEQISSLTPEQRNEVETKQNDTFSSFTRKLGALRTNRKTESITSTEAFFTSGAKVTYKGKEMPAAEFLNKIKNDEIHFPDLNGVNIGFNPIRTPFEQGNISSYDPKMTNLVIFDKTQNTETTNNGPTDVQQQYEGIGYNIDKDNSSEATTDEEAIQFLTKGSGKGVFFLARWFGAKKQDAALSIVDSKYEPLGQEKTDLSNLNTYLLACKDNPKEVFTKIFNKQKDFGDKENLGKLYDLYRECRNDQNGTKKGVYLKKVMGLLENYFVRGVKDKDGNHITTFKDMYNNELLGVKKDLATKDKKASKKLSEDEKAQLEEIGGTASEALNTKSQLTLPSDKFAEFKEKYGFDSNAETQFAMCLCDLNADGRIDSKDMNTKTGQELFNAIKDAKVDQKKGILEKGPMYNILNFAKIKAEQDGHINTAEFLKGIDLTKLDDEEIMNKIKERPLTMQYLKYMLINSPMDMANNIIRYGGIKLEKENTSDDLNIDKETREAINKIMSDERFNEVYENTYTELIKQGIEDTPEVKKKLRPIIALALLESSGNYGGGIAGGFDRNLGNARDITFILGAAYGPDGKPVVGISASLGKSRKIKGDNFFTGDRVSIGGSLGLNIAEGWNLIPMALVGVGYDKMINRKRLQNTLNARSAKYIGADANIGYAGTLVRGVGLSYSQDKMEGLNITYNAIKGEIGNVLKDALKEKWPNTTDKTEIRTQMTDNIKAALKEQFSSTDEEGLDRAAKNIFGGISYYLTDIENPSQIKEEQKTAIIEKIAENYATQRRNKEMQQLDGKTSLERVRIGVEFFNGYWPVPMASITLKTYGNLTADESQESIQNYYKRLSSGVGMAYIENSVSKEGDDKGCISPETIDYLNEKLAVLSPNSDVPKIQQRDENGDKNFVLAIPKNLCKYANISYDPKLEKYLENSDATDEFLIPANIKVGLLTYSRSRDGKYNLILGDYKKGSDFKELDINSKPTGTASEYEGTEGKPVIRESTIDNNTEIQELFNNPDFPLSECVGSENGKIYLKEKTGFNITVVNNGKIGIHQDNIISIPEFGKLKITKTAQGYKAIFEDSTDKKLEVQYADETRNTSESLKDTFNYNNINNLFDGIEKNLSKLDDNQRNNYVSFMDYASTMINNVLDENSYSKAFDKLKEMLQKLDKNSLKISQLKDLKDKIESGDLSENEKTLIVDRFKMIFSYHFNLTNGTGDYNDLYKTINGGFGGRYGRGKVYEELKGYNGEAIPESLHGYRDKILEQLKGEQSLSKEPWPSLIGMTAFYRLGKEHQGRGYSMTEIGKTTVLGNAYEEITDQDAINRFLENLKMSTAHLNILSEAITKKIQSVKGLENIKINNDNVVSLLEGNTLDISGIIFKIDMKYMFYLLGECGNESIGVNLGEISISGFGTTVKIGPDTSYEDSAGLSIDGVLSENNLNINKEKSQTYGMSMAKAHGGHTQDSTGEQNIDSHTQDSTGEQNINNPESTGSENISYEQSGTSNAANLGAINLITGTINSKD